MSRVSIYYDDGNHIDFNELADALFHATQQGTAGAVDVRDEESGDVLFERDALDAKVAGVVDESSVDSSPENRLEAARKLAGEA